jgi:hypothetical protein
LVKEKAPAVREHPGTTAHSERGHTVDEIRIPVAGDPIHARGVQDHPHACNDGWVSVGHTELDEESGEEEEVFEAVPCRRCKAEG